MNEKLLREWARAVVLEQQASASSEDQVIRDICSYKGPRFIGTVADRLVAADLDDVVSTLKKAVSQNVCDLSGASFKRGRGSAMASAEEIPSILFLLGRLIIGDPGLDQVFGTGPELTKARDPRSLNSEASGHLRLGWKSGLTPEEKKTIATDFPKVLQSEGAANQDKWIEGLLKGMPVPGSAGASYGITDVGDDPKFAQFGRRSSEEESMSGSFTTFEILPENWRYHLENLGIDPDGEEARDAKREMGLLFVFSGRKGSAGIDNEKDFAASSQEVFRDALGLSADQDLPTTSADQEELLKKQHQNGLKVNLGSNVTIDNVVDILWNKDDARDSGVEAERQGLGDPKADAYIKRIDADQPGGYDYVGISLKQLDAESWLSGDDQLRPIKQDIVKNVLGKLSADGESIVQMPPGSKTEKTLPDGSTEAIDVSGTPALQGQSGTPVKSDFYWEIPWKTDDNSAIMAAQTIFGSVKNSAPYIVVGDFSKESFDPSFDQATGTISWPEDVEVYERGDVDSETGYTPEIARKALEALPASKNPVFLLRTGERTKGGKRRGGGLRVAIVPEDRISANTKNATKMGLDISDWSSISIAVLDKINPPLEEALDLQSLIYEAILSELQDDDPAEGVGMKIGLIPMAAKPYHAGHHSLVKMASAENDKVLLFVSLSDRKRKGELTILGSDMAEIWKEEIEKILPSNVVPEYGGVPVRKVYDALGSAEKDLVDGITPSVYTVYSDPVDTARNYSEAYRLKYFPNAYQEGYVKFAAEENPEGFTRGEGTPDVSGTAMRSSLQCGDRSTFAAGLPAGVNVDNIYTKLCPAGKMQESVRGSLFKQKVKRLHRQAILQEQGNSLYSTFVQPFADVAAVTKLVAQDVLAASLLNVKLWWDLDPKAQKEAFAKYDKTKAAIDAKMKPIMDRVDKNLATADADIIGMALAPGWYFSAAGIAGAYKSVATVGEFLSGAGLEIPLLGIAAGQEPQKSSPDAQDKSLMDRLKSLFGLGESVSSTLPILVEQPTGEDSDKKAPEQKAPKPPFEEAMADWLKETGIQEEFDSAADDMIESTKELLDSTVQMVVPTLNVTKELISLNDPTLEELKPIIQKAKEAGLPGADEFEQKFEAAVKQLSDNEEFEETADEIKSDTAKGGESSDQDDLKAASKTVIAELLADFKKSAEEGIPKLRAAAKEMIEKVEPDDFNKKALATVDKGKQYLEMFKNAREMIEGNKQAEEVS